MYQKKKSIWQKHFDFILLDIICLQIAYMIAFGVRHGSFFPYTDSGYRNVGVILALLQICIGFFMETYKNILRRGHFEEFKKTIVFVTAVIMFVFTYLFITKTSRIFSRAVFLYLWVLGVMLIYLERICWKQVLRQRMKDEKYLLSLVIVTTKSRAEEVISAIGKRQYTGFYIQGVIMADCENPGGGIFIRGVPVVANYSDAFAYLQEQVVDEVFIDLPEAMDWRRELIDICTEMGITTHLNMGGISLENKNAIVETFSDYVVITSSIRIAEPRQILIKRMMDIAGGIVGVFFTAILTIILGPIIFIQSPGPVFFSQERVGRNGRKFRIYKFRSMYLDAEERKKELMEQNKMQGFMFKMDNDPRIIPIGKFIRKTSLDEFPQFFNVLKGDMSLVGTRPPTVDEYEQYEAHHKARLAAKPGLTGMWQVSGRSDIVDFEEVVKLDKKYIAEWNIGMDLRILFETVKVVVTGKGSV